MRYPMSLLLSKDQQGRRKESNAALPVDRGPLKHSMGRHRLDGDADLPYR
jgi:hypothetical protein